MRVLVNFTVLVVLAVAVILVLRVLRPRLRKRRMQRWEDAGLLPHQVDPYAPREDEHRERTDRD